MNIRFLIFIIMLLPIHLWAKFAANNNTGGIAPTHFIKTYPSLKANQPPTGPSNKWVWNSHVYFHQPFTDTNLCAGASFNVFDSTTATYSASNVFTVQLSDAAGNFSNPIAIGSFNSTSAVTITCTIPANTPSGGAYRIRVVASNPADTSADNGKDILITNLGALTAGTNSPVCYGDSLKLFANDTTLATTFIWTTPIGSHIYAQNPNTAFAQFADTGNYIIAAILNACMYTDTLHVTVKSRPAPPQLSSNSPICVGDTLYLYSFDSTGGVYYVWNGPVGFSSGFQNPVISNSSIYNSGTYTLKVTATNNCSFTDSIQIAVNPLPGIPTASTNAPLCAGDSLKLYASDTGSGLIWFWLGPNNFQTAVQNPGIAGVSLSDTGYYTVRAILNGCITLAGVHVSVNPKPAFPGISSNTPVCVGHAINLSASSTTAGVQFFWLGPNSFTSAQQYPTISNATIPDSGIYKVYTVLGNCVSDTDYTIVSVQSSTSPTVSISSNPAVVVAGLPTLFTANITNGGAYPSIQWLANGSPLTGYTVNPCYITPAAGDIISVYIISSNICANPNNATSNNITVKTPELLSEGIGVNLYPNPNKGNFTVKAKLLQSETIGMKIIDLNGKILFQDVLMAKQEMVEQSFQLKLPAGHYQVIFGNDKGATSTRPLVVE